MATDNLGEKIDDHIQAEEWEEARSLIEMALKKEPDNHWLLTQLGETYYEQRDYKKALGVLLKSKEILPDCPLTLWHLAGTLDALGFHTGAVRLYTWLLGSKKTPKDDPCWESKAWANSLKTDCVFRLGLCFKNLKQNVLAEYCFRKYIGLTLLESEGSYPVEEARKHLRELHQNKRRVVEQELQETAKRVLESSGEGAAQTNPPVFDKKEMQKLQEVYSQFHKPL